MRQVKVIYLPRIEFNEKVRLDTYLLEPEFDQLVRGIEMAIKKNLDYVFVYVADRSSVHHTHAMLKREYRSVRIGEVFARGQDIVLGFGFTIQIDKGDLYETSL